MGRCLSAPDGIELTNRYICSEWLRFDANLAVAHTRYRGWDTKQTSAYPSQLTPDAIGCFTHLGNAPDNCIPEGPPIIASADIERGRQTVWFGALKCRFKGSAEPNTRSRAFDTSSLASQAGGVTHVSGTICPPCFGTLT